jgi:hypothetical protein
LNSAGARTHSPPVWFTSSYSNGAGGECVECATTDEYTLVRDSKGATSPVVTFQSGAWRSFVQDLRQSESTD